MAWHVPDMWRGGECWIIGGGPSLSRQFEIPEEIVNKVYNRQIGIEAFSPYLSAIHDKHVIGVNAAFLLGNWVDIMCWGDGAFYWKNKDALLKYRGIKVGFNPNTQPGRPGVYDAKFMLRDGNHAWGITRKPGMVSWNKHTGGAAINLAYHLGVKRIYLLGFDMLLDSKTQKQHWHAHYPSAAKPRREPHLPFRRHLDSFKHILRDATELGLEIINVNPESAINHFPKVELKTILNGKPKKI